MNTEYNQALKDVIKMLNDFTSRERIAINKLGFVKGFFINKRIALLTLDLIDGFSYKIKGMEKSNEV